MSMLPALTSDVELTLETLLYEASQASSSMLDELARPTRSKFRSSRSRRIQEKFLNPLSPPARVLALAMTDVALELVPDLDAVHEEFMLRREILEASSDLLQSGIDGAFCDVRTLDELWLNLRDGTDSLGFAVATALALSLEIPLQLASVETLWRVEPRRKQLLLCYAIGAATRSGCSHALHLCSQVFVSDERDRGATLGVLKGLGAGSVSDGFSWLLHVVQSSVQDLETWAAAARLVAPLALELRHSAAYDLAEFGMRFGPGLRRTTRYLRAFLAACPPRKSVAFQNHLLRRWRFLPFNLRGALVQCDPGGLLEHDVWDTELHPIVLGCRLDGIEAQGEDASMPVMWLRRLLFHWDERLKQRVIALLSRRSSGPSIARPLPRKGAGKLLEIPPASLARTPLERLQVAAWNADSDAIVEHARTLPEGDRDQGMKLLLSVIEVPDMALRRAAIDGMGVIGRPDDGPVILRIARRLRTLEGHVVHALLAIGASVDLADLAELFNRRLKWADDHAMEAFCALASDQASPLVIHALTTRFFPPARGGAARAIAKERYLPGVFGLRKMALGDTNPEARAAASNALRSLNCKVPHTDELAGYVLSICPIKDLEAAIQRARTAGASALPGLRQTLAKSSWMRRRAACHVLATLPGAEAGAELKRMLEDADEDVRMAALEALLGRGWRPTNAREKTLASLASRRLESLLIHPHDRHLPTLSAALSLGGHVFRNEVLELLERLPGWSVADESAATVAGVRMNWRTLVTATGGVDTCLRLLDLTWQAMPHRSRLARGLARVAPQELQQAVRRTRPGWRAIEMVCGALGRAGDDVAAEVLEGFVLHQDDDVRRSAFEALGVVGTSRAAGAVVAGLNTPFREDRRPGAQALAAIGRPALATLREMARADWWEIRETAAQTFAFWRGDLRVATERLLLLALDPEPRVAQTARDALVGHGLRPSTRGLRKLLPSAQETLIEALAPWLGFEPDGTLGDASIVTAFEKIVTTSSPNEKVARLSLLPFFRAVDLVPWVESLVTDSQKHLGVRFAATEALRRMSEIACRLCVGRLSVDCPGCGGVGEQACTRCEGQGVVSAACPDPHCNAGSTTRLISSTPCKTCRGKGKISARCECGSGCGPCQGCGGAARIRCPLCDSVSGAS